MRAKFWLLHTIFIAIFVACGSDDDFVNDWNLDDINPNYEEVKKKENQRVEKLLQLYTNRYNNKEENGIAYDVLNIAFFTDSHVDLGTIPKESKRNVKDAIDFCNKSSVPITAIIHGGDAVTKIKYSKEEHKTQLYNFYELCWNAKMPFLFTKGNHDLNSINVPPSQVMNEDDWNDLWFDKAESEYGIIRNILPNGRRSTYYYYDLEAWKVRLICVDCFDIDHTKTNSEGNVLYWGGTSYYISDEQFNWVANVALNFDSKQEKDWGVIVFTHFYRPSDKDGTSVEPVFESVYKKFNSMLLSFNKQASIAIDYSFPQNNFYNLKVMGDWTRYSKLEKKPYIICVLSGHQHKDIYMDWWGVLHVVTANQFCGKDGADERIERVPGTRTQNLFDILNIDLKERKLRIIRYGASANIDGQDGNRFLPDGHSF